MKILLQLLASTCFRFALGDVLEPVTRASITTDGTSSSKKLRFATGYNFVQAITKNDVYLDKSLLVKSILELDKKIILLTCPPRFGKSSILGMLKVFLEPCVDETSTTVAIIPANETVKYKFFTQGVVWAENAENATLCERYPSNVSDSRQIFKTYDAPPLLSKYRDFVDGNLASGHVIYVNWTGMGLNDWGTCYKKFRHVFEDFISMDIFRRYGYLESVLEDAISGADTVRGETLKRDLTHLRKILRGDELDKTEILGSLKFLCKIMRWHLNKNVFILMDEWISPLSNIMLNPRTVPGEGKKIIDFISNFIAHTFQYNPYLEKAILTGVLAVNKDHVLANLTDHLIHYNVFHNDLYQFYGVAENDLDTLIDYFQIPSSDVRRMKNLYKGYTFKRGSNFTTYHIKYISDFLNFNVTRKPCGGNALGMRSWSMIDKFRDIWKSLLNDTSVTIQYMEVSLEHYRFFHNINTIWGRDRETDNQALNFILSFLFQMGTLTIGNDEGSEKPVEISSPSDSISVRIPNLCLKRFMKKIFDMK